MHTEGEAPNRLAQLRRHRGCRLLDVAIAADRDVSVIGRYERGETEIPDDIKARLAVFFGVSRAHLMGWDDEVVAA